MTHTPIRARDAPVRVSFGPSADRRSVLDRTHRGDIIGALGRVPSVDTGPRRRLRHRLVTLLAVMGPGVIVLVADNDAGGVSTYAQVGQDDGLRFLWLLLVLTPALLVLQEMVARLGAVTGAGHARLIYERFGRRWGTFALSDLLVLNFLIIVTEFIGVAFGLGYFGVSRYVSVPAAALVLIAVVVTGSFRRWERAMYLLVALSLAAVLVAIALIGTTVSPWQLFFQQSNVVDKRITARWLQYERTAGALGAACGLRLSAGEAMARDLRPDASLWTMPPIESLPAPFASRARTFGLVVLRCYLLLAAAAVVVKVITLIAGS